MIDLLNLKDRSAKSFEFIAQIIFLDNLMLLQFDIAMLSVTMVFCNKAQYARKGYSLSKYCNAVAGRHGNALWVSLSAPMDYVMPFGNRMTITYKACLAITLTSSLNLAISS